TDAPPNVALRVAFPSRNAFAVEAFASTGRSDGTTTGVYGAQVRQRIRGGRENGPHPFVTYGAMGGYQHDKYDTFVVPPVIGLIGVGAEWAAGPRLRVRVETQAV